MLTCRDIAGLATDRTDGCLDEEARLDFDAHVSRCGACQEYLRQLSVTVQALQRLPEPQLGQALEDAVLRDFDRLHAASQLPPPIAEGHVHRRRPAVSRRTGVATVAAVIVTLALLVGAALRPSGSPEDWTIAAALAAAAVALAAMAGRFTIGVVGASVAAAAVAALVAAGSGPLAARTGIDCLAIEIGSAAVVATVTWIASRGASGAVRTLAVAAGASVGALAGDAVLEVACAARSSLPHLLVFHVGGVVLAGVAALWISGRLVRTVTA